MSQILHSTRATNSIEMVYEHKTWFEQFSLSSSMEHDGVCTFHGNTRAAGESASGSNDARLALSWMLLCAIVSAKRGGLEIHKNEGTRIGGLVSEESERQIERTYLGV